MKTKKTKKPATPPALPVPRQASVQFDAFAAAHADWLLLQTGQPLAYWFARIQALIVQYTDMSHADKPLAKGFSAGHGTTDVGSWVVALAAEVLQRMPRGVPIDGNMWAASVLGCMLTAWFARLLYAKANDPVRPLSDRQPAYHRYQYFVNDMVRLMTDISQDATFLPNQKWQSPFVGQSTSGKFR